MPTSNASLADTLESVARLLHVQNAADHRARAWQNAAESVRASTLPLAELWRREGADGLQQVPHVGPRIASALGELLSRGRLGYLDRLRGEVSAEEAFGSVPGIGPSLAHIIATDLGLHTLEQLEVAAHDGRLRKLAGFGARRTELVKRALRGMLAPSRGRALSVPLDLAPVDRPDVAVLLHVDEEYRRRAAAGELHRIAPRRFNPANEAWLPILHTDRGPWSLTALFSNTPRAHELGRTHDWVVIYYERDGAEGQCTVVTDARRRWRGRRVVRGREAECIARNVP